MEIVIIGAGNVATHLSKALVKAGNNIKQIYSRTEVSAKTLAKELNIDYTTNIESIDNEADLYIFSVSDNAIPELALKLDIKDKNVVHTAGSVPLSVLKGAKNYGVFYPLQTFSKSREVNFKEIPLCIEANNNEFNQTLTELAGQISKSVWQIDSVQRKRLHLSAVFACNFVNHMYALAKDLLSHEEIDFEILYPLIKETAIKATTMGPKLAQTGPALRNDTESLEKHIELLSSYPEIQKIYRTISESIQLFNK
jgi:predicted short-subunit dehydrogenase-like oxidoreductase (DUF2520 family)